MARQDVSRSESERFSPEGDTAAARSSRGCYHTYFALSSNGRSDCRCLSVAIPEPERIGLVHPDDKPQEWWVTLDGKSVVGFTGLRARERAEKYFGELKRIAQRAISAVRRHAQSSSKRHESETSTRDSGGHYSPA